MDTLITSERTLLDPIAPDWTIAELLEWLGDESRQHDAALRHPLARIEAAVTGETWHGTPSTVALIRSLAASARTHGAMRLGDIVRRAQTARNQAEIQPFAPFEAKVETPARPDRSAQVA
ncbi:hypothetical protein [Microbacterium aurantiacum]|uniref:hypothetical protein n=1 Tax=Microbacterium aurantiacum TaxID=162393 RepID=UPI000C8074BB|nr:hypothetical protein [Microbacterium aurantiacum]